MRWALRASVLVALLSACGGALPGGEDRGGADDDLGAVDQASVDCTHIASGTLVLSEVLADAEGSDDGREWVEVFNASASTVSVNGLSLYVAWDSERKYGNHPVTDAVIEPYSYLLLAAQPVSDTSSVTATTHLSLPNSAMRIALLCEERVIDAAVLDAPLAGSPWVLDGLTRPDSILNDQYDRWCAGADFPATPGGDNPSCNFDYTDRGQALCLGDDGLERSVNFPVTGEVVITEIMADPFQVSDTQGEWVELQILADVDLNASWIEVGTGAVVEVEADECLSYSAGDRVVFVAEPDEVLNGGILGDFDGTLSLTNSGGSLGYFADGYAVDATEWPQATAGVAWQRDPVSGSWCLASNTYGFGDKGTPGATNAACANAFARPTTTGDLIFTEIMKDPKGTEPTTDEWFEMVNLSGDELDLGGCVVHDGSTATHTVAGSLKVAAGAYVLFAQGDLTHSTEDYIWTGFELNNTGSESLVLSCDDVEIDRVDFASTGGWPSTEGRALSLDDNALSATQNDLAASWCAASTSITGALDYGTPATANPSCP